jgi:hypothetical protein
VTEKMYHYVIQYAVPRPGKRGTGPGWDWRLLETNSLSRIERRARKVARRGWRNGAGYSGGYYDRKDRQFKTPHRTVSENPPINIETETENHQ